MNHQAERRKSLRGWTKRIIDNASNFHLAVDTCAPDLRNITAALHQKRRTDEVTWWPANKSPKQNADTQNRTKLVWRSANWANIEMSRKIEQPVQTQHHQVIPVKCSFYCKFGPGSHRTHRSGVAGTVVSYWCWEKSTDKDTPRCSAMWKKTAKMKYTKKEHVLPWCAGDAQQLLYIVLHFANDNELAVFSSAKSHKSMWLSANRPLEQHIHPHASWLIAMIPKWSVLVNSPSKCWMILLSSWRSS